MVSERFENGRLTENASKAAMQRLTRHAAGANSTRSSMRQKHLVGMIGERYGFERWPRGRLQRAAKESVESKLQRWSTKYCYESC